MDIPYLSKKFKEVVFGDDNELTIKEFKERTVKIRLGGKEWLPLCKDGESMGIWKIDGLHGKIRIKK